jgi:Fe-S oxidoreductase
MWKVDYPKLLDISTDELGFKVMHLLEYADQKLKDGSLKLKKSFDSRVVYHDACSVSRLCDPWTPYEGKRGWMGCVEPRLKRRRGTSGLYSEPRDILKAIPGVEFVEMPRTKKTHLLLRRWKGHRRGFPEFSSWAADQRLEEVKDTGAETLVSACPWCKNNFSRAVDAQGEKVQILDISEVICAAIERQEV